MSKRKTGKNEATSPQGEFREKENPSVKESSPGGALSKETQAQESSEEAQATEKISAEDLRCLEEKARERDLYYDRLLRATAELVNYQNRVERERRNWERAGMVTFLGEILPVIDNFHRAIASAEKTSDVKGLIEGLRLVDDQFHKILEDFSVKPIESVGKAFDPRLHEAVVVEENGDLPDQTVIEELQRGYILEGKVIRPARVKVSKKPQGEEPSDRRETEKG